MAMLAGPRRKQKVINLRAKNNAWSNDNNKFGQRMLEKMGWSSGKGLGAQENGIVEHVVARYKNDDRGLGFEDKNDQWTKHEDDFNALLANLSNAGGSDEKLHSGVSLEVKSKKSKARVHYHKFTRGKDLTRYSAKDLANIFGKKSLKKEENVEEPPLQEDVKITEQVFTEKGSMEDYFKSKLANFKSKNNLLFSKPDSDDNAEYAFKGFSTNTCETDENEPVNQGFGFTFYSANINKIENESPNLDNTEAGQETKLKKKKKNKNKDIDVEESCCETQPITFEHTENITSCNENVTGTEEKLKAKKKSKKKNKLDEELNELSEETKPKNKKSKNTDSIETTQVGNDTEQNDYVPKKKKKRKNKDLSE